MQAHILTAEELTKYGRLATKLRTQFTEKADALKRQLGGGEDVEEQARNFDMLKLNRGCKKDKSSEQNEDLQLGFESR